MTVREKKQEEEMAELRALLASKIKENEELKAAPPKTVHDPTQYGPRAQLTIRQQEQPPQQEEETVFTVEVKTATPEKVTSQQSQYDASPDLRGSVSREGGRSRSPSPISSPRAAAGNGGLTITPSAPPIPFAASATPRSRCGPDQKRARHRRLRSGHPNGPQPLAQLGWPQFQRRGLLHL